MRKKEGESHEGEEDVLKGNLRKKHVRGKKELEMNNIPKNMNPKESVCVAGVRRRTEEAQRMSTAVKNILMKQELARYK